MCFSSVQLNAIRNLTLFNSLFGCDFCIVFLVVALGITICMCDSSESAGITILLLMRCGGFPFYLGQVTFPHLNIFVLNAV